MADMLKSSREEDQRRRDEAQFYSIQQQVDELRRQLRENLARQQWFEELYKQSEGKISQVQISQDRLNQDVAQALHARQIDDGRMKAQITDLGQRVESPDKQLREMRAQIGDIIEQRRTDRDSDVALQRQIDDLQRQLREMNSFISQVGDAGKHVRETIAEVAASVEEVRQDAQHISELQRLEEQRLRRQGVELQGLFEALRQQFSELAARSQRVDDVRHQLMERIDAFESQLEPIQQAESTLGIDLERVEKQGNEQYVSQQERLELVRAQFEEQLSEVRQLNDQRTDRVLNRFAQLEDRLRIVDQALAELPTRFEALERRDEVIGSEADTMEEWLVTRQMAALETMLDDVRKRRSDRASNINPASGIRSQPAGSAPGSVYNPSGLIKSVRDARPPTTKDEEDEE